MPVIAASEVITYQPPGGKVRELKHANLSWGQSFSGGLPENMALTYGDSTWTGSVDVFPSQGPVTKVGASPYAYGYPRPGEKITIRIKYQGKDDIVMTPMIDSAKYSDEKIQYELIHQSVDVFRRGRLRLPPVFAESPRTLNPWGSKHFDARYPSPTALWHVSEAFREAGFHTVPPRAGTVTRIDISCQGAFWSNQWRSQGEIIKMAVKEGAGPSPTLIRDGQRTYMANGEFIASASENYAFPKAGAARLSCLIPPISAGEVSIWIIAGEANQSLYFTCSATRQITVWESISGQNTQLGTLTMPSADILLSLCVCDGRWELATETSKTGGTTRFSGAFTGISGSVAPNGRVAGIQVDEVTSLGHRIMGWKPNLVIGHSALARVQPCLPAVRDRTPQAVLDEIAGKLLAAWWVDGQGVAHFEPAEAQITKPISHTLTALEHIGEYGFTDDLALRRSAVRIKYSETSISSSNLWGVLVWQGNGGSGAVGDTSETFVGPGDDEEWGDIDWGLRRATAGIDDFNTRNGSWYAAIKGGTGSEPETFNAGYTLATSAITPWLRKISDKFTSAGARKTPSENTALAVDLRGMDMPILRARSRAQYVDAHVSQELGGSYPALELDCTRYVGRRDVAESTAALLASLIEKPQPQHEVLVAYDPALDIGKVVLIEGADESGAANLFGASLRCLISGVTHTPEAGTTKLTCRVIREEAILSTWEQIEAQALDQGLTWAQLEAENQAKGLTWAQAEGKQ